MTDRNVQFPNRYQLTKVDGTDDIYDLTPAPGTITEEGTMINKSSLLQDITCDVIGIEHTSTPNEAFLALALGVGQYGYVISVVFPDGSPVVGAELSGTSPSGDPPITDNRGIAIVVSAAQTINVTVKSPYIDILDSDEISIQSTRALTQHTVTLQPTGEREFTSSFTGKTSPYLRTFDLCAVGAGGGCGGYSTNRDNAFRLSNKPGGGGGYVENLLSVQAVADKKISVAIGAGGTVGGGDIAGGTGGDTTVTYGDDIILEAEGGQGGPIQSWDGSPVAGGTGNGNGGSGSGNAGNGTNGGDGTGFKFNDESLGVPGGGGGGGGRAQGGAPHGGDGSTNLIPASAPGPGGGGGGGSNNGTYPSGSAGGNGIVYFRPHYKGNAA